MPTQSEIDHDYKRSRILLEDTDSFVLAFILYRDINEQRENAQRLKDLIDLPVTEVALKGDNLNPVRTFLSLPKEPRQAIFFTFLGSSLPEGKSDFDKFAGYVNIQREAFTDAPHAVVLWLREEQLVRLMRRAPDFWAWRSGVFDVRGELQPETTYRELEEVDAVERGELEHQVALYREILKGQLERYEPDLAYIARTRLRLVEALRKLGLYEEALIEAQEVVALAEGFSDESLLDRAINDLAVTYVTLGRYNEAEPLHRRSLTITERIWGKDHPAYAVRLNNLATLLEMTGRYNEAETMYREAISIGVKTLGEGHPNYATWLNNLAGLLESEARFSEAESLYREALEINREALGEEHPNYASELNNLAVLLERTNRYSEAEQFYRRAIDLAANILGKDHPSYASRLANLARVLAKTGRYNEAEMLYREAITKDEQVLGRLHPNYANKLYNLASLLVDVERRGEAEVLYREALDICNNVFGTDHPNTRLVAQSYAHLKDLEHPSTP